MSGKSPAFQWYVNDFLGSGRVRAMSLDEVGAYTLLLNYDWNEVGLPDELAPFSKWLGVTPRKASALWDAVRPNFTLREGRWYNPRLEKERAKQEENRRKKSAAATHRWHPGADADEHAPAYAPALHMECPPSSIASSSTDKDLVRADIAAVLGRYKELHPRRKVVGSEIARLVERALKNFSAAELGEAIEGNAFDPWHREKAKHELSYVLRSAEKIGYFRELRRAQITPRLIGVGGEPSAEELASIGIKLQ